MDPQKAAAEAAKEAREGVKRIHANIDGHVEKLNAQQVCVLKVCIVGCSADASLAGASVKLKCRGEAHGATLIKSSPLKVPSGGEQFSVPHASSEVVFEGDKVFQFEICEQRLLRPSLLLACGDLDLQTIFASAGLCGESESFDVPLLSGDDISLASVTVSIGCETRPLSQCGGFKALKALALPPRPESVAPILGGKPGARRVASGSDVMEYCRLCLHAKQTLQKAHESANEAAGATQQSEQSPDDAGESPAPAFETV